MEDLYNQLQEWEFELEDTMDEFVEKRMKEYKYEKNSKIDANSRVDDLLKGTSEEKKEDDPFIIADIDELLLGFKKSKDKRGERN